MLILYPYVKNYPCACQTKFFSKFYLLFCEEIVVSFSKYLLEVLLQNPPDNVKVAPRLE